MIVQISDGSNYDLKGVAKNSLGELYAVYLSNSHVFVKFSVDGGVNWSDPISICTDKTCWKACIAIDSQDNIHIVYQAGTTAYDIYYRKILQSDSTVYNEVKLTSSTGIPDRCQNPSMAIDSWDTIHLVYDTRNHLSDTHWHDVKYLYYNDGWSSAISLNDDNEYTYPTLMIDGNDDLHVVATFETLEGDFAFKLKHLYRDSVWHIEDVQDCEEMGAYFRSPSASLAIDGTTIYANSYSYIYQKIGAAIWGTIKDFITEFGEGNYRITSLGVDGSGVLYALVSIFDGNVNTVWESHVTGTIWSTPIQISELNVESNYPCLVYNNDSNNKVTDEYMATWSGSYLLYINRQEPEPGPEPEPEPEPGSQEQVVSYRSGSRLRNRGTGRLYHGC